LEEQLQNLTQIDFCSSAIYYSDNILSYTWWAESIGDQEDATDGETYNMLQGSSLANAQEWGHKRDVHSVIHKLMERMQEITLGMLMLERKRQISLIIEAFSSLTSSRSNFQNGGITT
jgi:hypothetical protein